MLLPNCLNHKSIGHTVLLSPSCRASGERQVKFACHRYGRQLTPPQLPCWTAVADENCAMGGRALDGCCANIAMTAYGGVPNAIR